MSSAVMERPRVEEDEWIVLDSAPLLSLNRASVYRGLQMRGHGVERHGLLAPGSVAKAPADLVALPAVDDID